MQAVKFLKITQYTNSIGVIFSEMLEYVLSSIIQLTKENDVMIVDMESIFWSEMSLKCKLLLRREYE